MPDRTDPERHKAQRTEWARKRRAALYAAGLKPVTVWVRPERADAVKRLDESKTKGETE